MKNRKSKNVSETIEGTVPLFAYELIRDTLIPNLLGKETDRILYWAGKELAQQYPLKSFEDVVRFFDNAGFGTLALTKKKKNKTFCTLSGTPVSVRMKLENVSFNLEAGFLAQQVQSIEGLYTEAMAESDPKRQEVILTLQCDKKDLELLKGDASEKSDSEEYTGTSIFA